MSELLYLSDVCQEWFGLTERTATRKACNGLLPIPAFRLTGTRKGKFYVRKQDFDLHVQRQIEKAEALNSKMRAAGLV